MTIDTGTGTIPYPVPIGAYMHDMDPIQNQYRPYIIRYRYDAVYRVKRFTSRSLLVRVHVGAPTGICTCTTHYMYEY